MIRLNIGCGPNMFPGWTNIDREDMSGYLNHLRIATTFTGWPEHQIQLAHHVRAGDVTSVVHDLRDGFPMYTMNSVDAIYLGQVVEHMSATYEFPRLLSECYRILKPGGAMRITTPDLEVLLDAYRGKKLGQFASEQPAFYADAPPGAQLTYLMFGASGPNCTWDNYEGHFVVYDYDHMTRQLTSAGFESVEYFWTAGHSGYPNLMAGTVDAGMSHSFAVECQKPQ